VSHEALLESLIAGDRTRSSSGPHLSSGFLGAVIALAERYARLEKLLFGGPRVAYSSSALDMNLSLAGDVLRQGEDLAEAERRRLELADGPVLELGWLVEDQGVKILPRPFPSGSAARGGFFFDSDLGPCILVDAGATPVQRDYIIAHQLGHFLADFDPYVTTICGHPGPTMFEDPRELRAHQFALAFLMPRHDLEIYRQALEVEPGAITADFVRQLQIYFAVDFEMVFWRLLSIGWIAPAGVTRLLEANADFLDPVDVDRMDADERLAFLGNIPERLVHLVASAFGRGILSLEDAAEYLETDVDQAKRALEQFHYEDPDAPRAPSKPASKSRRHAAEPDHPSPN
jgi:Zn-dependent peptidase ImmA (M78 family)